MVKGYGFLNSIGLLRSLKFSRLFFSGAKIVRYPIYIRNKSSIKFGRGFITGRYCRIDAFPGNKGKKNIIEFGENCQINDFVHIAAVDMVKIGNDVLIASRVFISDHNHGSYSGHVQSSPNTVVTKRELVSSVVKICDNVWIGEGVSVLPGVTIGRSSIVASNSVVTKSIPEFSLCAGNPAKVIKQYNFNTKKWEKVLASTV